MSVELSHKTVLPHIFSIRVWIHNTDTDLLKTMGDTLLEKAEFRVLNFVEHYFPVKGYTALWLLAESHLAIHTFPDGDYSYLELSGCNEEKTKVFFNLLEESGLEVKKEDIAYNGQPFKPAT
ncbi:hypothetical protein NBRC110019_21220 [Neptunitalea chrysea]|uniref:S-adenosylmethionine decarboxylase n=1 Tax=Neptunitalea chrysea TaxID=1647581 RepID=A0A9W6B7Z7_9FLAO|nr:S-adenosylmethionine decarboxylase [Neptunitalea chrysea]GLB53082.1 hypothetical protein NBRC110019_21220 [Neptunitalea chrysea]